MRCIVMGTAVALLAASGIAAADADFRFDGTLRSTTPGAPRLQFLGAGPAIYEDQAVDGVSQPVLAFGRGEGLVLRRTDAVASDDGYTIGVLARLDEIDGRRRLVDFRRGTQDGGLYERDGTLAVPGVADGSGATRVTAGTWHQYVLTRDASSRRLTGYIDGLPVFGVDDAGGQGAIGPAHVLRFFADNVSGGATGEESAGHVARLRLLDRTLDAEQVAQLDWLPQSARHTSTINFTFVPASTQPVLGGEVEWRFYDQATHTATDTSGLAAFDSGPLTRGGTFRHRFQAAGTYTFDCQIHPSMQGTVAVPMRARPTMGSTTTAFRLTWATARAAPGFVYDVQVRRPGSASFTPYLEGRVFPGTRFTPDAGPGLYEFQARLRQTPGSATGYSPVLKLPVS